MKRIIFFLLVVATAQVLNAQGVAVNTDGSAPHASAMLDVKSTNKGFLMPRMATADKLAIPTPSAGLMVYDTTSNLHWIFNGTTWESIGSSGPQWINNGSNIFTTYTGNVGIGLNANINEKLTVKGNMLVAYPEGSNRAGINLMGTNFGGGTISFLKPDSSVTGSIYTNNLSNRMFIHYGDNPYQLMLNANGRVGINNLSPTKALDVVGSIRSRDTISSDNDISAGQDIHANGDINAGNNIHADGNLNAAGLVTGNGLVSTGNLIATGTGIVSGNLQTNTSLTINDPAGILQLKASGENKGFVQLSGDNIRMGTNSENEYGNFIVRTNGADKFFVTRAGLTLFEKLYVNNINTSSGNLSINPKETHVLTASSSAVFINNNIPLQREEQGANDLLPLGYASISAGGTKISGTSNITSRKDRIIFPGEDPVPIPGNYIVECEGVTENSIVQVTINQPSGYFSLGEDNVFFIRARPSSLGYVEVITETRDSFFSTARLAFDCSFFITIFK